MKSTCFSLAIGIIATVHAAPRNAAAPGPEMVNPCVDASSKFAKMPWCNAKLPIDTRVNDMVRSQPGIPLLCAGFLTGGGRFCRLGA